MHTFGWNKKRPALENLQHRLLQQKKQQGLIHETKLQTDMVWITDLISNGDDDLVIDHHHYNVNHVKNKSVKKRKEKSPHCQHENADFQAVLVLEVEVEAEDRHLPS